MLQAGALGTPHNVAFRLRPGDGQGPDAYLARQPYFQEMERFLVHETAIHLIDTFRFLLGEIDAVFAWLRRLNPAIAGEDAGYILFRFANGAAGLFDGNRLNEQSATSSGAPWARCGWKARAACSGSMARPPLAEAARRRGAPARFAFEDRNFGGDCVHLLQRHVVAHLQDGAPLENDAASYLRNVEIEEAVYRSAGAGRWVTILPDRRES